MPEQESIDKALAILHTCPKDFRQFTVVSTNQSLKQYGVKDNTYDKIVREGLTKEAAEQYCDYLIGSTVKY